jgi:hypothetical protein
MTIRTMNPGSAAGVSHGALVLVLGLVWGCRSAGVSQDAATLAGKGGAVAGGTGGAVAGGTGGAVGTGGSGTGGATPGRDASGTGGTAGAGPADVASADAGPPVPEVAGGFDARRDVSGSPDASMADAATPAQDAATDAPRSSFVHPGILVSQPMLDFVHAKLATGAEPWTSALAAAKKSSLGSLTYTPHPIAVVECGSYSNPDIGCTDEKNDADAAYTQALLWVHTGDESYARKSVEIMNGWSSTITDHTNSNAPLQSAWVAEVFPRAAEIIRATYTGWAAADIARFTSMLKTVYLPKVAGGSGSNGNWELSMIEAAMNIGVFTDDTATFDKAVKMWRARVPAYLYLATDGATPVPPPTNPKTGAALVTFWYDQTTYADGLCQETCRDLGHVQYGLAAMINAAETALIQGVDLFGEQQRRLVAGLEFHANYLDGAAVPSWLCGGALTAVKFDPMWEIAVNELGTRGESLPHAVALVAANRPTGADHHMAWETLTHAQIGGAR